ncbi:MAG: PAS domain S-box protein [Actinobacteria bacterium]|nr:PAS domain S-box protein [Actinomycetota bacterium]
MIKLSETMPCRVCDRWIVTGTNDGQVKASASRAGSDRIAALLDHSPIGFAVVSPDGCFLEVNPALCELLGRDASSLKSCSWQEMTHPEDLPTEVALVNDMLAGRQDGYRLSKRYVRPDGSVVWGDLSVCCVRLDDGSVDSFIAQVLDVSEQQATRQALTEAESRYHLLVKNSSDVVALGTNEGFFSWISPTVEAMLGWQPKDLVGTSFTKLVHQDDRSAVHKAQGLMELGDCNRFEVRMRTATGEFRWVSIRLTQRRGDQGEVVGKVASWSDSDDEHALREALAANEKW